MNAIHLYNRMPVGFDKAGRSGKDVKFILTLVQKARKQKKKTPKQLEGEEQDDEEDDDMGEKGYMPRDAAPFVISRLVSLEEAFASFEINGDFV